MPFHLQDDDDNVHQSISPSGLLATRKVRRARPPSGEHIIYVCAAYIWDKSIVGFLLPKKGSREIINRFRVSKEMIRGFLSAEEMRVERNSCIGTCRPLLLRPVNHGN